MVTTQKRTKKTVIESKIFIQGKDLNGLRPDEIMEMSADGKSHKFLSSKIADLLVNSDARRSTTSEVSIGYLGTDVIVSKDMPPEMVRISARIEATRGMKSRLPGTIEHEGRSMPVTIVLSDDVDPSQVWLSDKQVRNLGIETRSHFKISCTYTSTSDLSKERTLPGDLNEQPDYVRDASEDRESAARGGSKKGAHKVLVPRKGQRPRF